VRRSAAVSAIIILFAFATMSALYAQNVQFVSSYDTPGMTFGVFVQGDYAYVADGSSGLQVLNVADPANPVFVGSYNTPGTAQNIFVSGNYAYVADMTSGLQIIDITDPTHPAFAGSADTMSNAYNIYIQGNYAYVADGPAGLQILNIADPTNPTYVGSYPFSEFAACVRVQGDYAYIAIQSYLYAINVSNPEAPTFADRYNPLTDVFGVFVQGDYAYSGVGGSFLVLNVTNPSDITYTGIFNTPTSSAAIGVFVLGNYAYVANDYAGLLVIDVSNPANPFLIGSYNTAGEAIGAFVVGNYIYVADVNSLVILRFNQSGINDNEATPNKFSLEQNYPNPFNAQTKIAYSLAKPGQVSIDIYDILGRKVTRLAEGDQEPGNHEIIWDANEFVSGVYFYKLTAGDYRETKRMLLLK
jgi:hypothetical protein